MRTRVAASFAVAAFLFAATVAWAGAESDAAASSERGIYLADRGIIVPPEEIYVDSQIASIDYRYPEPSDALGMYVYASNRRAGGGQEQLLHVGIQGGRTEFTDLPPLNLAFVIDVSGPMNSRDKLSWVKDSFDIVVDRVRPQDFVALVTFSNEARVVFPSTRMTAEAASRFRRAVRALQTEGGTNLFAGLQAGYAQVQSNYRGSYVNRLLFLTDGQGGEQGVLEMAGSFRNMDINVSTIGVGLGFNLDLMRNLARRGGDSSRFIANREKMEETFGSELDRMIVPAARSLEIVVSPAADVRVLGTWGYQHQTAADGIHYRLPTLHNRDYETILLQVETPAWTGGGTRRLATVHGAYLDPVRGQVVIDRVHVEVAAAQTAAVVHGISDAMVLKSGTMLHYAQGLPEIGRLYYRERSGGRALEEEEVGQLIPRVQALKRELNNARVRLDEDTLFPDEMGILDNYLEILGGVLSYDPERLATIRDDLEIRPVVQQQAFAVQLETLFQEIGLSLADAEAGTVAIGGFYSDALGNTPLLSYLDQSALVAMAQLPRFQVVERERFDAVIAEQKLSLSDLMDTENAIEVGNLLACKYIFTGAVVAWPGSLNVFARVINSETGVIESVAQVITPRTAGVESMLQG